MSNLNANAKAANALISHDYCAPIAMDSDVKRLKNTLASPGKTSQPPKKAKTNNDASDANPGSASIADVLKAIHSQSSEIQALHALIVGMKSDLQQNTIAIANINKSLEFNSAEIQECKEKNKQLQSEVNVLKEKNDVLGKKVTMLEEKVSDAENYKRRWNLRLKGIKEEKGENTRQVAVDLLLQLVPHWKEKMGFILDTVHRLGRPNPTHPRPIIMQFTMRIYRDELWKVTYNNKICKEHGFSFAQDFSKDVLEARAAVWPKVDAAKRRGDKVVYRGRYAYINGQRVTP